MKSSLLGWTLGGLVMMSAYSALGGSSAPVERKSADGIELPAAAPDRKLHSTVALVGPILGEKPEEVGRVFNCKKSAQLLAKRASVDLGCDWFVINVDGADVAGLNLTDGRISKVVLFYEIASQIKVTNLRKQVEAKADKNVKVTVQPIEHEKKQSLMISFEIDAIEMYLATHTVDAKIVAALRSHTWIATMNDEQALMVGDGPGKYLAIFAPDPNQSQIGAGTVFAEGGKPTDVQIELQAKNKQDAREEANKRHKNLKDVSKIGG